MLRRSLGRLWSMPAALGQFSTAAPAETQKIDKEVGELHHFKNLFYFSEPSGNLNDKMIYLKK